MSSSNINGRNRFPFTASQWQELEHQALIFKYMVSGIPIPPDLLFTIKRSFFDPSLSISPKLFPHQHEHVGSWNCFQIGVGRKVDPEPGRCRRTDGKKWRCSKEAYPDSKYCERHMHRGKNRSRKPVEVELTTTTTTAATTPSTQISSLTQNSSHNSLLHQFHSPAYSNSQLRHSFLFSSKSGETVNVNSSTHLVLDSGSGSDINTDYRNRYVYGLKEDVDEHDFFSEASGSIRNFSGSSMDDSWQFTPLTMSSSFSSSSYFSKQRRYSGLQSDYSYLQLQSLNDHTPKQQDKQDQHCFVLGTDIKSEIPLRQERELEERPQKTVHRFFDEWPPKTRDSLLDLDDKSSNTASVSRARLSISIPSAHDFPILSSTAP